MAKARFVSRYGAYSVGVQSFQDERLGHDGKMVPARRRIDANFQNKLVNEDDLTVAVRSFTFTGLPEDTDTNEHISPRWRCSVWDAQRAQADEGWSDDEIEKMVSALRKDSGYGIDHIEVTVAAKEPIPGYDGLSEDEIVKLVAILPHLAEGAVEYERENQNRESLLNRLEGVESADDAVVVNAG